MNERVEFHAGTRAGRPAGLRSPFLQQHGASLAEASVASARSRHPELAERLRGGAGPLAVDHPHGALRTLDAAMSVGDPTTFLRYADWLVRSLAPSGVDTVAVETILRALADAMAEAPCPADLQAHRSLLVHTVRAAADRVRAHSAPRAAVS
jgi:hypothetical protein